MGPTEEVLDLVVKAQQKQYVSPLLAIFLSHPENESLFFYAFARQVQLLKSRSQAFEDGHTTVYDKTLLTLTRNGNDLDNPAAIEFFCEEFLGITVDGNEAVELERLRQSVALPKLLTEATKTVIAESTPRVTSPGFQPLVREDPYRATIQTRTQANVDNRITPAPSSGPLEITLSPEHRSMAGPKKTEMEQGLARLWSVYEKARGDFVALQNDPDFAKRSSAARFLRDTAENTLEYLKDKHTDPIKMVELQATHNMATAEAISLTGGKRRKFDEPEMEQMRGTPRGPSNPTSRIARHSSGAHGTSVAERYRYAGRSSSYSGGRRTDTQRPARLMPRPRHSGSLFGYTRPVDSYYPR